MYRREGVLLEILYNGSSSNGLLLHNKLRNRTTDHLLLYQVCGEVEISNLELRSEVGVVMIGVLINFVKFL